MKLAKWLFQTEDTARVLSHFSRVWLFVNLWTRAHQDPLSLGFSREKYWSGLPSLPPRGLPNPGMEPESPASSALQVDSLPLGLRGSPENKRHTFFSVVSLHYPQLTEVNTFLGNLLNSVKCNTRAHSWLTVLARHLFGFRTFPICSNTDEPRECHE